MKVRRQEKKLVDDPLGRRTEETITIVGDYDEKLAKSRVLHYPDARYSYVESFASFPPGSGRGDLLMREVEKSIDRRGEEAELHVLPDSPYFPQERLRKFYGKHGFKSNARDPDTMSRERKK